MIEPRNSFAIRNTAVLLNRNLNRNRNLSFPAPSMARPQIQATPIPTKPKPKSKSKDGTAASTERKPKVAIVGAGWGGFGAAKALCEAGCDVTLLDGIPDPTGMTPSTTPTGKPFEYGTRGFWKDYPNIEATLAELGVRESDVFSDFTASSFFSPDGLEATAPVFSSSDYPQLPSPFGQVFATFDNFKRLPLEDRVTMVGLLYAMLDLGRDDETFEAYDRMTAHDLFITFGLSKRLVDDFIRPTCWWVCSSPRRSSRRRSRWSCCITTRSRTRTRSTCAGSQRARWRRA